MPLPDNQKITAEIVSKGTCASQGSSAVPVVSIWHYRRTTPATPLNKVNVQGIWQTTVGAAVEAAMNITYTHVSTDIRMLEDNTDPYLTTAVGNPGAIAGDRMPPQNVAFLFMRTAYRGRQFMGRKFLSPMSESDSTAPTADLWNAGALGRLAAIGAAHLAGFTDLDGNVWKPVVVSKLNSDFSVQPALIASQDITAVLVNKRICKLKRRLVSSVY